MINNVKIGDKASFSSKITDENIALFAQITEDNNPLHIDEEYAKKTMFKGKVAHGMYVASFISSVIANKLPGKGSIYLSQNLKFIKPVRIDDIITAEVEVVDLDNNKNRISLKTICYNQENEEVIIGEAIVIPPGVSK